jgi:hypothetical protein
MAEVHTSEVDAKPAPVSLGLSRAKSGPLLGFTGILCCETVDLIVGTHC